MIVSRCPVRVSLAGGSTDLESYLQEYKYGTVIGFSADIYCYINMKTDRLGLNGLDDKYVIDYMSREVVTGVDDIKNDIARTVLSHYKVSPTTLWFTSDIYASGSGLASSTAYLIASINAMENYLGIKRSKSEVCALAHALEKSFNPLTGYQDPYVCGMGGFNRFHFHENGVVRAEKLKLDILESLNMYLVSTGATRSSTEILGTLDVKKCFDLVRVTEKLHLAIEKKDMHGFLDLINEGWKLKKQTGKIIEDPKVSKVDDVLSCEKGILAHRLLGAGNGGYFLVFANEDLPVKRVQDKLGTKVIRIKVCNDGPTVMKMG